MAKKTRKQCARSEKNIAGCMSGLISMFDFRPGHLTQRLLSDRRHESARYDSAGSGHSRRRLNLLTSSEDNPNRLKDVDRGEEGRGSSGTSVKILMEEEMSISNVHQQKKAPKADSGKITSNESSHGSNHRRADKTSVLSYDLHLNNKSSATVIDKSNSQNKIERFSYDLHLAAFLEEFCGGKHQFQRLLTDFKSGIDSYPSQKSTGEVPGDFLDQPDSHVVQDYSTLHKALVEIAEALINQDEKAFLNRTSHQPEELVSVLEVLNSKELLLKLLQNPSSLLVKHMQEIGNDQEGKCSKAESGKVLDERNVISRQCDEPVSHRMFQKQSVHEFFRKKEKLRETKASNGNDDDDAQPLNTIVVLKPTPSVASQDSPNATSPNALPQSHYSLRAKREKERVASHFTFKEIKRRLKHVIGDNKKEQHMLSMDGALHRIPYESQQAGDSSSMFKDGVQTKRATKASHNKEQASQLSFNLKMKDKQLNMKEARPSLTHEVVLQNKNPSIATTSTSPHTECNFRREARKHLVEMLNIVDGEANLPAKQISKPLGRILSMPEYNLSPRSPGREKETCLSPRQMRFSPLRQLTPENGKHFSPLKEIIEESPCTGTSRILDQSCDSYLKIQRQEKISSGETSSGEGNPIGETSSPKEIEDLVECIQERETLNVPSKLNVSDPIDVAERIEGEGSSLSPRANSSEMLQTVTLLVPSIPVTLLVDNIGPLDSITEKPERPSPVSVLEPVFIEDLSSPVGSTDGNVDFLAQPRHIHFEEEENSAIVLTSSDHESNHKTCSGDRESRFQYVRAVLEASGLIQTGLSERWYSPSPLLSPSLYDDVEYSSDEFPDDLRHLFDSIGEALEVIRDKFFGCTPWVSFAKPSIRPILSGDDFIIEVWRSVDLHNLTRSPRTLDQIVGKDMEVGTWMDLRYEFEGVSADMGEAILEDITVEILLDFLD